MDRAWLALGLLAFSHVPVTVAQAWFDQAEHPGPMGDFTAEEREAIKRVDPGIEGSPAAVGSAKTNWSQLLRAHGAEPNPETFGVYSDSEWEAKAGVKILNATPFNVSGSTVVQTDHGLMHVPMVWIKRAWKLQDRPRRMALMVIEMIEDYRPYLGYLVPQVEPLLREFRTQGFPVFFSTWSRRPGDGLYGGLDRAGGYRGLAQGTNIEYTYKDHGSSPMKELMPTDEELSMGHFMKSIHLNKFRDLDKDGRSILAEKLKALEVDTLVLTGGWTDACILATALDAVDAKNLDVIIVSDAVGTSTAGQQAILNTFQLDFAIQDSESIMSYLQAHQGDASYLLAPHGQQRRLGGLKYRRLGELPSESRSVLV